MKNLIFLIGTFLLANNLFAQHEFVETKRVNNKNTVAFTDTIYIKKTVSDTFDVRMNGFLYKAAIFKNTLGLPYGNYTIIKNDDKNIIIEKEGITHYFTPKNKTHNPLIDDYERNKNTHVLPEKAISNVDIYKLEGKWEAYKRANRNGPSDIADFKSIIKNVEIAVKDGQITGFMKSGGTVDYLFEIVGFENGNLITLTPNKQKILMPILGQSEREWIFEDNKGIVYYMYRK